MLLSPSARKAPEGEGVRTGARTSGPRRVGTNQYHVHAPREDAWPLGIEADPMDIETAMRLLWAVGVLGQDDLPPQIRRVLAVL